MSGLRFAWVAGEANVQGIAAHCAVWDLEVDSKLLFHLGDLRRFSWTTTLTTTSGTNRQWTKTSTKAAESARLIALGPSSPRPVPIYAALPSSSSSAALAAVVASGAVRL